MAGVSSPDSLRVCVLGAGLMGAQIGCVFALAGHDVALVARDLDAARDRALRGLADLATLHVASRRAAAEAGKRISYTRSVDGAAEDCDLILESLPEDLGLKVELLGVAARRAPEALLASNTSSLRITEIGRGIGAEDRTIGTHFWNPPLLMPLVEVVAGEDTRPERLEAGRDLVASLGKTPVSVQRDVPGFVWNRLQLALVREAVALIEEGVIEAGDLDDVVKNGLARRWHRVGPLTAISLGGLATWNAISAQIVPSLSNAASLPDLKAFTVETGDTEELVRQRDIGLATDLLADRVSRRPSPVSTESGNTHGAQARAH